jgi:recombination protein RecT
MNNTPTKNIDTKTISGFSSVLKNYEKSIVHLLQNKYGISADEFYASAVNAIKKNPKLLQCEPHSLFGAILLSAECGLRFNTPEQHAFIIPYKNQAQFQIGYKGLIEIMYRNPRVRTINAVAVYKKDEFDYGFGLEPYINHKPHRGMDRGELVATYAVCRLKDADPIFSVVEDYELAEIKKFSQTKDSSFSPYNSGADVHHFMEIKASIKKLSKLIPTQGASDMVKAIDYDSRFEGGGKITAPVLASPDEVALPQVIDKAQSGIGSAFDGEPVKKIEPTKVEPSKSIEAPKEEPLAPIDNGTDELDFSTFAETSNSKSEEDENTLIFDIPAQEKNESGSLFDKPESE